MKKLEFAETVVVAAREFVADFKDYEATAGYGAVTLGDAQRSLQELKDALAAHAAAPCEHRWSYPDKSHPTCYDCGHRVEVHSWHMVRCECGAGPLECYREMTRKLLKRRREGKTYPDIEGMIATRLNDCRVAMTDEERAGIEAVVTEEKAADEWERSKGVPSER